MTNRKLNSNPYGVWRRNLYLINQKRNEFWKRLTGWLPESRMTKGIAYDETSISDLLENAADPQGRHDHHLWPIPDQREWPHETCHRGVRHSHPTKPWPDITSYVSLRSHSDIPRISHRYRPLSHHAEGSFALRSRRVWERCLGVVSSGSKSAGYGDNNHPHPILTTHPECSLSDFPYEKPDRHLLSDDCRASWKCGVSWDKRNFFI